MMSGTTVEQLSAHGLYESLVRVPEAILVQPLVLVTIYKSKRKYIDTQITKGGLPFLKRYPNIGDNTLAIYYEIIWKLPHCNTSVLRKNGKFGA